MSTISQRDLRNDNAEIMRRVEQGESFTVTRRGVPVATVSPIADATGLPLRRKAKQRPRFSQMRRAKADVTVAEVVDDLRGER